MSPAGEPPAAALLPRRAVLMALLGAAFPARERPAAAAEPRLVALAMTDYRFMPDRLSLPLDLPCRLRLVNRGTELHELTAPEFLAAIALETPEVLAPGAREVVLRPGERKELRFTAHRPGRYPMACADHDWAGMVGEIIVA